MFANANHIVITGGAFTQHQGSSILPLDRLLSHVAANALHNSEARYDPPQCHPETRIAIRDHLHQRINGSMDPETRISFLYGPAGSGKSAILQTMAEECFTRGRLLASFFFWKSDDTRNNAKHFVATLCYQIMKNLPSITPLINDAIQRDPLIFRMSLRDQMKMLVIQPLQTLFSSGVSTECNTPMPNTIIIDGLDECSNKANRSILLHSIAELVTADHVPITILISSRPEVDIMHLFNNPPMEGLWRSFVLDRDYESDADIRCFLDDSFRQIKSTHPYGYSIPQPWPRYYDIDTLVNRSSGQFIFASVVIKYISALDDLPQRRLETVMGLRPPNRELPFSELDAMYAYLLKSHPNVTTALTIISVTLSAAMSIDMIAALLSLGVDEIRLAMDPLRSILRDDYIHATRFLRHASFEDFLNDRTRSGEYFIGSHEDCLLSTA